MDGRWRAQEHGMVGSEEPYRGRVGRTRVEPVLVPAEGGGLRPVHVHVAVDVQSDPHLAERIFSGRLHQVGEGPPLAVPFVYHDPQARRFALVVPETLRHRVLQERAAVLRALAEDAEQPVPPYVARVPVVLGVERLGAWLQGEADAALFEEVELIPEETTHGRGVGVEPRGEVSPELGSPQPTATGTAAPSAMEPAFAAGRASDPGEPVGDEELQLVAEESEPVAEPTRPRIEMSPPPPDGADDVGGALGEAEPVDELEGLEEVSGEVEVLEEIDAADLVEEADEEEVSRPRIAVPSEREGSSEEDATAVRSFEEMEREARASARPDSVPPPPEGFERLGGPELLVQLRGERLWLHARLQEGHEEAFSGPQETDLLVQLAEVEGCPVALLTLVDRGAERPYARRAALDPRSTEGEAVLRRLAERFEASVAVHGPGGRYVRRLDVAGPREENVRWLLERVGALRGAARVDAATAMERALAVPPPLRTDKLPFETAAPSGPLEAERWLRDLEAQAGEEALQRAALGFSVPVPVLRAAFGRALAVADRWGLPPGEATLQAAARLGAGEADARRIGAWLEAFARTEAEEPLPESTGVEGQPAPLPVELRREAWRRLLELANLHDAPVPEDVHERAWRTLHAEDSAEQPVEELGEVDPERLGELSPQQLGVLLDHPRLRAAAAVELCRRGEPELLPLVYRAVRRMPREDVATVVPHVLRFGEAAADVLVDGLGARKTFVRQASAIALGRLKLRRAVTPLVHLLLNEPSEVWREVARVLGALGSGAVRSVVRAARDPKGQEERIAMALAHLAAAGQREAVERLAQDGDPALAGLGRRALELEELARQQCAVVEGEGPEPSDPVLAFGRRLEAALRAG